MARENIGAKIEAEDFEDDFFYDDDEPSTGNGDAEREKIFKRAISDINSADCETRRRATADMNDLIKNYYTPALIWGGDVAEKARNFESAAEAFKLAGKCGDKEGARRFLDLVNAHLDEVTVQVSELEMMAKVILGKDPAPVVSNPLCASMGWAERNDSLLDEFLEDPQMGLVREKPVFVAGQLQRQYYMRQLVLRGGEQVTWNRVGSTESENIHGAIDVYEGTRSNGRTCGRIYICIYANHKPKSYDVAPVGYEVNYKAVICRLSQAIAIHESGEEKKIREQIVETDAKSQVKKSRISDDLLLEKDKDGIIRGTRIPKSEYKSRSVLGRKEDSEEEKVKITRNDPDEFTLDISNLLKQKDVQGKTDIYKIEYDKALKLIDTEIEVDACRAMNILTHLEELCYIPAIMFCAHMYESKGDEQYYPEAVQRFKKAADLGDGEGARCYADMRMAGKGIQKDQHDAIRYYAMAADRRIPEATFVIGEYFRNRGDKKLALKAYREAYEGGYKPAHIRMQQLMNKNG